MKYFFLFLIALLAFWYIVEDSTIISPKKRSRDFLNEATSFYVSPGSIETIKPIPVKSYEPKKQIELKAQLDVIVKNINNLYDAPQAELANNISTLKEEKKQLELILAYHDFKVDRSLLLDPSLRIILAVYLDRLPSELTERHWMEAEIPSKTWNMLMAISQSNDFRILLLENNMTKDEIEQILNKAQDE